MDKEIATYLIINTIIKYNRQAFRRFFVALNIINLLKIHKHKKENKFIVSER